MGVGVLLPGLCWTTHGLASARRCTGRPYILRGRTLLTRPLVDARRFGVRITDNPRNAHGEQTVVLAFHTLRYILRYPDDANLRDFVQLKLNCVGIAPISCFYFRMIVKNIPQLFSYSWSISMGSLEITLPNCSLSIDSIRYAASS